MTTSDPITFSFGANWQDFVGTLPPDAVMRAYEDSRQWLTDAEVTGKSVIDIGCGSGIHSLIFQKRGAASVLSIDVDDKSIAATAQVRDRLGATDKWTVRAGSVLDAALIERLAASPFDIVYSWGVLHHTGALWTALDHAIRLVAPGGCLWISLYAKGPLYGRHLALKKRYNAASSAEKWLMERRAIAIHMLYRLRQGKNPVTWNEKKARGMDTWHDLVDWLGGLPYEVAGIGEVVEVARSHGLQVIKIAEAPEGSCHVFLFRKNALGT